MISTRVISKDPDNLFADPVPEYPYGMRITIEEDVLRKLGVEGMPAAGTRMRITALAEVLAVEQRQDSSGDARRTLTLQITDMDPPKQIAGGWYTNSEMA